MSRDARFLDGSVTRHVRKTARIARWEVSHAAGEFDRRTVALGVVALLLAVGVAGGSALAGGVALDTDLYRVAVSSDSPYYDPVENSRTLEAVSPSEEWDVRVVDENVSDRTATVRVVDSPKGRAALAAFREAVQSYNERLMARESNQSAAFPVRVTLVYESREAARAVTDGGQPTDGRTGEPADGGATPTPSDGAAQATETDEDEGPMGVPRVGGGLTGVLSGGAQTGTPGSIQPPFPFASLVLAFAFLVPLNFVVQAYGSTILDERINRRGELLLVAPVTPGDIVAGKTLPYLAAAVAVTALIAAAVGGSVVSVLAVFPVALVYLAAIFVGGMFARSFKELTFVTVSVSVFLTSYTFVPAIFTNVTPIALISPLTLVVHDLQGTGVTLGNYLFSTGPFYLSAGVLFLLGLGVYREEDMFTQRSIPLKFLDALDARLSGRWSVALLTALFIPFVFVAELLAVAILFALPVGVSLPVLLVAIAAVEELAKSVHVYAGFAKGRFRRDLTTGLTLGALSGLGFFVGEKVTIVVQLVGLPELQLGRAAFATSAVTGEFAAALLFAPLVLHVVTAATSAVGATRGRAAYAGALVVAVLLHAAYNLTVVSHVA